CMVKVTIVFDRPNATYLPGEIAKATVTVVAAEPSTRVRSIKLNTKGVAHTQWDSSSNNRHKQYSADCYYISREVELWRPEDETVLEGVYVFTHQIKLPDNCAPSVEGRYGYIRYRCKVIIDRPGLRMNQKEKKAFSIARCLDLNSLLFGSLPITIERSEKVGLLFNKGDVQITARINHRGFVAGDTINLEADIDNRSSVDITKIKLKLLKSARYCAYRDGKIIYPDNPYDDFAKQRGFHETVCKL
ncbi:hypothetical protein PFISCL1PPCAC_8931, partial [Pristionchus fissidentatus]